MHSCPLYTKSKTGIASKCFLQLHKTTTTNLPTQTTPDVWILTTPDTSPINTVTLICPEKPMKTIPIQQLIHILKLPTACSATSSHFYLPPRYRNPHFGCQCIPKYGKSSNDKHLCTTFLHMATLRKQQK